MKTIGTELSAFYQKLLAAALAMLGFSSCNDGVIGGGADASMYGAPYFQYTIKGAVKDEAGKPIISAKVTVKDIAVRTDEVFVRGEYPPLDVDSKGEYRYVGGGNGDFRVIATDAAHEADSVEVHLELGGGDGGWNWGEAEETVDFVLKKLDDEE